MRGTRTATPGRTRNRWPSSCRTQARSGRRRPGDVDAAFRQLGTASGKAVPDAPLAGLVEAAPVRDLVERAQAAAAEAGAGVHRADLRAGARDRRAAHR